MFWLGRISSHCLTHVVTTDSEYTWLSLSPATSSERLCLEWVEGRSTGRAVILVRSFGVFAVGVFSIGS